MPRGPQEALGRDAPSAGGRRMHGCAPVCRTLSPRGLRGAHGGAGHPHPREAPSPWAAAGCCLSDSSRQVLSSAALLPGPAPPPSGADGPQGGEAPGDLAPAGGPPGAAVPFYNPAQFAHASAASGSSRTGRISQRKYPALS